MPKNFTARDKKLYNRKNAMKMNSRGLITIILPILGKVPKKKKKK